MPDIPIIQPSLWDPVGPAVPATQGIKYAGSKRALLPHILSLVHTTGGQTVLDGFAGTTRVGQALAGQGYTVWSNDRAAWSKVFGTCYLLNQQEAAWYQALIDHLNNLPPSDGWFTQHYGGLACPSGTIQAPGPKKPWQVHNTRKLDAIRQEIADLSLDPVTQAVALTSLILALDRVDNTLGHFASYLKGWAPRSYDQLVLQVPHLHPTEKPHRVYQQDILALAERLPADTLDLAYLDPPYGSQNEKMPASRVRYAAYYHLWTSVVLFDRPPLFGKALRRCDTKDRLAASVFEEFRRTPQGGLRAIAALERLVALLPVRWVLVSYSTNPEGLQELTEAMQRQGRLVQVLPVGHKKHVMARLTTTKDWAGGTDRTQQEYILVLDKG